MGSVSGAIEVLESVIAPLEAEIIVPGHGPVFGGTAPIEATLAYLQFVSELAAEGHRDGLPPLEVARGADLGRFASWPDAERLVGNLHRAYAELAGASPGTAIDIAGALSDMVAFNGGAPLTCLA
jgi:cyclase